MSDAPARLVQHKTEARWFYRYLSRVYDALVNPFFWTETMRESALDLALLDASGPLDIVDVGSGTGFTTEGIVARAPGATVTCLDQSPDQQRYARAKPYLKDCTFLIGDAEALPFEDGSFDRYVSAGSIEYWPDPQRGITEAYRVLRLGGIALMIGPLRPANAVARWAADTWMLFPEEDDYVRWFRAAGFTNLKKRYVRPAWVLDEAYAVALSGKRAPDGPPPLDLGPREETGEEPLTLGRLSRLVTGSLAGGLFIPMALLGRARAALVRRRGHSDASRPLPPPPDPLTPAQKVALGAAAAVGVLGLSRLLAYADLRFRDSS